MNLKQFLKPGWRKILILVIFAIYCSYIWFSGNFALTTSCGWNLMTCYYDAYLPALIIVLPVLPFFFSWLIHSYFELGFLLTVLYWYLISCLIVWVYDKLKVERK